jgi:chromosomal replication initiator protein
MDDREIVSAIRAQLAQRVGKERYDVWFGRGTQLAVRANTLEISVPTEFFQGWLRRHFRKDLESVSQAVCGRPVTIEFRIDASLAAVALEGAANGGDGADEAKPACAPQRRCANSAERTRPGAQDTLPRRPFQSLDAFVVGDSNCVAHKTAQLAAQRPGSYSPLLVYGPTGSGKTHLLEGVCSGFRRLHPRARTLYLSAEQFTSIFLEALHGSGLPSFRRKHRDLDLLAIDDLQFFANKRATLVELLNTIDTLMRAGRQLVFAADRSPAALKFLGGDLVSRLSGGMACRIEPPEHATRLGIVRRLAAEMEMSVPEEVQGYIAAQFTTQSRELAGALNRLAATSLAHERPISLAMAEEALAELIDHQGRPVKLADIDKAVRDVFGLDERSLQSSRKAKTVSHPRMLAMWLARKHTRAPLSEIGSYFGRRSHSTVISAQKKIDDLMANGNSVQWAERTLNLEETIRRVEEQLRA